MAFINDLRIKCIFAHYVICFCKLRDILKLFSMAEHSSDLSSSVHGESIRMHWIRQTKVMFKGQIGLKWLLKITTALFAFYNVMK